MGGCVTMFGQELNDESYAICKADMLIKGQDVRNIVPGNTLSEDGHAQRKFDYMLSNPPFGVEWKKVEKEVRREAEQQDYNGRFGPGLPRISDGSLLFLLHLLSKMRPAKDEQHRILGSRASSEPGPWRTSRTPYRRDVMDALSAVHPARRIVFMRVVQMPYTAPTSC